MEYQKNENILLKKRGRKPKIQILKEDEIENKFESTIPKKRGRKPKEKIYSVSKPITSNFETIEENIILHLPITLKDLEEYPDIIYNNVDIKDPEPFEPKSNFDKIEKQDILLNQNNIDTNRIIYVKDKEIIQVDDNIEKKLVKRNIFNIMFEFIDNKEWLESTTIWCFWCNHSFDNPPCAIPIKYINNKFYLYGNFCSFNCAASYNFSTNVYNMWERYSLLNLLYKKIYNTSFIKIKLAPDKEVLKNFGGFMLINEFRNNFLTMKTYNVIYPPMISIVPRIEENIFESKLTESILINDKNNTNSFKLKRDKPINDPKGTLESFLDLQIKSKDSQIAV